MPIVISASQNPQIHLLFVTNLNSRASKGSVSPTGASPKSTCTSKIIFYLERDTHTRPDPHRIPQNALGYSVYTTHGSKSSTCVTSVTFALVLSLSS